MSTPVDPVVAAQNREVERQLKEVRPGVCFPVPTPVMKPMRVLYRRKTKSPSKSKYCF